MSDKQLKVALCGQLRSGKDSVGKLFIGSGFHRFAFGDKIKEVISVLGYRQTKKPRAMLQGIGQSIRQYDPEVWVKALIRDIEFQGCSNEDIIITDLRQPNEYKELKAAGYIIVRVAADEELRVLRSIYSGDAFNPEDIHHETESHVASFFVDYQIENNGSIAELEAKTMELIKELRRGASSEQR